MTREEAIDRLKEARAGHKEFLSVETLNIAIEALEQEPCIQEKQANADKMYIDGFKAGYSQARFDLEREPCEDAISRQEVLDVVNNPLNIRLDEIIKQLPSVKPQEKTGHWKYDYTSADGHRTYHCSKCGCYLQPKHSEPLNSFKWCHLCGAKMVEPQESEEV